MMKSEAAISEGSPAAKAGRRAVIEIGTNSVKLLVADVVAGKVQPVWEESIQTRLGRGFYESRCIQKQAVTRTTEALAKLMKHCRHCRAESLRIVATSAVREAANQQEFARVVSDVTGKPLEILSGQQEAEMTFRGIATQPELAGLRLLVMDLGGGSTEFILGERGHPQFSRSFELGCVRLLERLKPSDPPQIAELEVVQGAIMDFLASEVRPVLEPALRVSAEPVQLVCTGGTAFYLARMELKMSAFNRKRIESLRLSRDGVRQWVDRLWQMPLEKRKCIVGLTPNRADVILMGVAVVESVMDLFKFDELRVTTRSLRFAAVLEPAAAADGNGQKVQGGQPPPA